MNSYDDIYKFALSTVKNLGTAIVNKINTTYKINEKSGYYDLVTEVDKEVEYLLSSAIIKEFSNHSIIGEEGTNLKKSNNVWFIDPIDGTLNFIQQKRNFVISLAYYEDDIGKVGCIYDVIHDEMYSGISGSGCFINNNKLERLKDKNLKESLIAINHRLYLELIKRDMNKAESLLNNIRGMRTYGSAALEMAYVATGRLDAYITPNLSPWDFAAGRILIEESGGKVSTIEKKEININEKSSFFASNNSIYNSLISYF